MTMEELDKQLLNENIIRNKLKVYGVRKNARIFLTIQKEFGSFDKYLWAFVNNKTIINKPQSFKEVAASTAISDALSKDLKKRGMTFVGSTIMYAFMQAIGMIDDHLTSCWKNKK